MNRPAVMATSLVALCLVFMPAVARAAPITTLFSTGVGPAGLPLPDLAADPHYVLTASPGGFYPVAPAIKVAGAEVPPGWVANTGTSGWINPTGLAMLPGDWHAGGTYVYATTFDLTGFIPTTASVLLGWAADDNDSPPFGVVLLNGAPVPSSSTGAPPGAFAGFHPVALGSGLPWLAGLNTLEFVVFNTDTDPGSSFSGPTGIHVTIVSAEADLIPEPSSAALLTGATWVMLVRTRRRSHTTLPSR